MKQAQVGIIGGTGLDEVLTKEVEGEKVAVDTPFGPPSSPPIIGNWEGVDVAFLARHGEGHQFNPSTVPYRANIWALKRLGVSAIIASGAAGSLREEIEPGHLVLCDQVIDKTFRREATFFDRGIAAHVEFADPFCQRLRALLTEASKCVQTTVHDRGVYVCMEGPQFSTKAESQMHRAWGGDLIGMTSMPEAKLAREAEICYALIALPTDYDSWRPRQEAGGQDALLQEIIGNLRHATDHAIAVIHQALKLMRGRAPGQPAVAGCRPEGAVFQPADTGCRCRDALKLAIWSDLGTVAPAVLKRFEPLIGRYLPDADEDRS